MKQEEEEEQQEERGQTEQRSPGPASDCSQRNNLEPEQCGQGPACDSSSLAFCMMYAAYKLNKQGDNIQP